MGNNSSASQMSNYSGRNVRVYITETAMEMDAFISSHTDGQKSEGQGEGPGAVKFRFKPDASCVRVPASETHEVVWESKCFLSVFVEDEEDENICSKKIMHNMMLSAPVTVLLYDV